MGDDPSTPRLIQNRDELAITPLRRDALDIIEAGYGAVLTDRVIRSHVRVEGEDICIGAENICLTGIRNVFVVAIGKCAVEAARALEDILGRRITDGIVLDVKHGVFSKLRSFVGSHPFPSDMNVTATQAIVTMLTGLTDRDIVFVVVSGGGSALLCLPHDMRCETLEEITKQLWKKGASIHEVNTVRKHLSDVQGGQLAKIAHPAHVVGLIFSDVPGNDIGMVASGPTVLDTTTVDDAARILARHDVMKAFELPEYKLVETPKDPAYFANVRNILLATVDGALMAMQERAMSLGYSARIENAAVQGNADALGEWLALLEAPARACVLLGGETTVEVHGKGRGGRNQELALSAARVIGHNRVVVACASDGWDNGSAAGAIADAGDRERALAKGISIDDVLARNDSARFWEECGGAIRTDRTGINVADLYMVLTE